MTPLPPELEALMPEPAAMISLNGGAVVRLPYFTADQMREAIKAATERERERAAGAFGGVLVVAYALPTGKYELDEVRIERARQMSGEALWAVRRNGSVLNKQGHWEYEPMPSSRDDEFLARARFGTAEEAIATAIRGGGREG